VFTICIQRLLAINTEKSNTYIAISMVNLHAKERQIIHTSLYVCLNYILNLVACIKISTRIHELDLINGVLLEALKN
jgi:hypothetical protein